MTAAREEAAEPPDAHAQHDGRSGDVGELPHVDSLRLRDRHRDAARLVGFWQRPRSLVLPAFGSFTGGHAVRLQGRAQFHAIVDDRIVRVDARQSSVSV